MIAHTKRRISAGTAGGFNVWTAEAAVPGPRVVILGGVHGDETQGVLAAGRFAVDKTRLTRGSVDIIPVCHEAAFEADSRTSPIDGGNLARVFPGLSRGGATEQLAHHLFIEVLSGADLLIDLHTSGQSHDMPFLVGYQADTVTADSLAKRAASAFGADFLWRHPDRSEGRTVSVVNQAIYVECPGGGTMSPTSVDAYVVGLQRVLAMMDMIGAEPPGPARDAIRVTGGGDLDRDMISVRHTGMFVTDLVSGAKVEVGQLLGAVVTTGGQVLQEVHAPHDAWVLAIKRRPPVIADDLVVCLATSDEEDDSRAPVHHLEGDVPAATKPGSAESGASVGLSSRHQDHWSDQPDTATNRNEHLYGNTGERNCEGIGPVSDRPRVSGDVRAEWPVDLHQRTRVDHQGCRR